ncbi:MAG: NUDIX domain-containing protein [Nitrospirae bacterium]|nr:NUDIX domain-containing protein [Nitrospirota bacterium]
MKALPDNSYGVIPVGNDRVGILYLLIRHVNGGHWAFPKGHANEGEEAIEAARRELAEETGITDYSIIGSITFREQYTFRREGQIYDKTVQYFLAQVNDADTVEVIPQQAEVSDFKWVPYEEALGSITFEESRELLKRVNLYLTTTLPLPSSLYGK